VPTFNDMNQFNLFIKGLSSDLEPSKRDPMTWDFPALNWRVINKEGQGLILTPMYGNTKVVDGITDPTAHVLLSEGYYVVGACAYNGRLYIASRNVSGDCELGMYPGVDRTLDEGFVDEYKPLQNFKDNSGNFITFNTAKLHFNADTILDMFAYSSYDGSVDLYICDGVNPNMIINSGVNDEGELLDTRVYSNTSFPYSVRMIKATGNIIKTTYKSIDDNGTLLPGNYFLFFRYVSNSFDRTPFITELGPVAIFNGKTNKSIEGIGDELEDTTTKSLTVELSNLDQDYSYIEVGVWRYHGISISVPVREEYLVHKYYNINGDKLQITIYGTEEKEPLTVDEVIADNVVPNCCKTHTVAGGRYYGANWTDMDYDRDAMATFAKLVVPTIVFKQLNDISNLEYESGASTIPGYKDQTNILDNISHRRGEIYPYGIRFLLNNNHLSEAFPIQDWDFFLSATSGVRGSSDNGLVRMPYFTSTGTDDVNDLTKSIGVRFSLGLPTTAGTAAAYWAKNKSRFENVIGFYLVMGERIPNMITQGIAVKCYNKANFYSNDYYFGNATSDSKGTESTSLYMPLPGGMMLNRSEGSYNCPWECAAGEVRYALFSPEYIFKNNIIVPSKVYIQKLFQAADSATFCRYRDYPDLLDDIAYEMEINNTNKSGLTYSPSAVLSTIADLISENVYNAGHNWSSRFDDANDSDTPINFAYNLGANIAYNLRNRVRNYIGLRSISTDPDLDYALVSLLRYSSHQEYKSATWSAFRVSNTQYSKISEFIEITSSGFSSTVDCYKGDTFLSRTSLRVSHFEHLPSGWTEGTAADDIYAHGFNLSFISENDLNTQLRNTVENAEGNTNTFFPKCLDNGEFTNLLDWGFLNTQVNASEEALAINAGYGVSRSDNTGAGIATELPYIVNRMPDRIWYSAKEIQGSYRNNLRIFGYDAYVDFPASDGPINCIRELFGRLITISDSSIREHIYNESQYRVPTSLGEMLLGTSDILAEVFRELAPYGSSHGRGIVKTERGLYGIDTQSELIWAVRAGQGGLVAEDISVSKQINSEFKKILASLRPDTVMGKFGEYDVRVGYNPDTSYKEVYFTISNAQGDFTITYSEKIDAFTFPVGFYPRIYVNTKQRLFSALDASNVLSNGLYQHDDESGYMLFYGVQGTAYVSFYVNGNVEGENSTQLEKVFRAMSVISGEGEFEKIEFSTEMQEAKIDPFIDTVKFWQLPVYKEGRWEFPLPLQSSELKGGLDYKSELRGNWLKVTIYYNGTTSTFIQSVKTIFNQSLS